MGASFTPIGYYRNCAKFSQVALRNLKLKNNWRIGGSLTNDLHRVILGPGVEVRRLGRDLAAIQAGALQRHVSQGDPVLVRLGCLQDVFKSAPKVELFS